IYLPQDDLSQFGVATEDLIRRTASNRFKDLLRFQIERTRAMFVRGKPLCLSVSGRLGLELRAVWLGGMRILERIEENGYDVFKRRPVISSSDKITILLRAVNKGAFRRY